MRRGRGVSGRRQVVSWLLIAATLFVAVYVVWIILHPGEETGNACRDDKGCRAGLCYREDARHLSYCTKRCEEDGECPKRWKCLTPPRMPGIPAICIKP